MKNLWYLVAAYSSVWLIVATYLVVLLRRNRRLEDTVSQLETRIELMESRKRGK